MKKSLALLLLSCALVAQDKPAAEAPKPAAVKTAAEPKPKVPPINVRDELIELVHQLKPQAFRRVSSPYVTSDNGLANANIYDADLKSRAEAQRLLLQALVELAKDSEKNGAKKVYHSSNPPNTRDE